MNTEIGYGRRVVQTGDVYQVMRPIQGASRSFLRYYLAQYRVSRKELGNANRSKDKKRIAEALRRVAAFKKMTLDLMLAIRMEQTKSAYERDMASRTDRLIDATDTAGIKSALFAGYQRKHGVV